MRIERNTLGTWEIKKDDTKIAIEGRRAFETFEEIVKLVQSKGLHVWGDGTIHREPEPTPVETDPVEALSAAQEAEAKKKARNRETYKKRKERYANDPAYRAKVLEYQKQRRQNKKDSK